MDIRELGVSSKIKVIKHDSLKWKGHVQRMEERLPKQALGWISWGEKTGGKIMEEADEGNGRSC